MGAEKTFKSFKKRILHSICLIWMRRFLRVSMFLKKQRTVCYSGALLPNCFGDAGLLFDKNLPRIYAYGQHTLMRLRPGFSASMGPGTGRQLCGHPK